MKAKIEKMLTRSSYLYFEEFWQNAGLTLFSSSISVPSPLYKMLELQNSISNYWRSKMKNASVQNIYL